MSLSSVSPALLWRVTPLSEISLASDYKAGHSIVEERSLGHHLTLGINCFLTSDMVVLDMISGDRYYPF